jgi:hypothetical protein
MRTDDTTPRPSRRHLGARGWMAALSLAALTMGLVGGAFVSRSGSPRRWVAPCRKRAIAVQLSSSDRSPDRRAQLVEVLEQALISAVVCDKPIDAYGVAGGGATVVLVTTDDATRFARVGPNARVRMSRLTASARTAIRRLVAQRVDHAFASANGKSTTVAALYRLVAEHATHDTDVLLSTDGVNHDDVVDLNRPLAAGEGMRGAHRVSVPRVGNTTTTLIGLGQVDSVLPPPGPTWLAEVRAFNEELCRQSASSACRLFSSASVSDALS